MLEIAGGILIALAALAVIGRVAGEDGGPGCLITIVVGGGIIYAVYWLGSSPNSN